MKSLITHAQQSLDRLHQMALLRFPFLLLAFMAVFFYSAAYLYHPALVGNGNDWWTFHDQSLYLRSVQAFANLNFASAEHWYPPGYALLGSSFYRFWPVHPFFFINAACLIIIVYCFIQICKSCGVSSLAAGAILTVTVFINYYIIANFAMPWTSTPVAALIFIIIVMFLNGVNTVREHFLLGLAGGLITLFRPSDIITVVPIYLFLGITALRDMAQDRNEIASVLRCRLLPLLAGGVAGIAVYGLFYLLIYGFAPSSYIQEVGSVGFVIQNIPMKFYILFIDPFTTYIDGTAILARNPWILISLIGLILSPLYSIRLGVVALCVLISLGFYLAFNDFTPTHIWRFHLIHYIKWAFPILGLFCWLVARDLVRGRRLVATSAVATVVLVLSCLHLDLGSEPVADAAVQPDGSFVVPVGRRGPIDAIDLRGVQGAPFDLYFENQELSLDGNRMAMVTDYRVIPAPWGTRIIFIQSVEGTTISGRLISPLRFGNDPPTIETAALRVGFGLPRWIFPRGRWGWS